MRCINVRYLLTYLLDAYAESCSAVDVSLAWLCNDVGYRDREVARSTPGREIAA